MQISTGCCYLTLISFEKAQWLTETSGNLHKNLWRRIWSTRLRYPPEDLVRLEYGRLQMYRNVFSFFLRGACAYLHRSKGPPWQCCQRWSRSLRCWSERLSFWIEFSFQALNLGEWAWVFLNVRKAGSETDWGRSNSMAHCPCQPVSPHSKNRTERPRSPCWRLL